MIQKYKRLSFNLLIFLVEKYGIEKLTKTIGILLFVFK